MGFELDGYRGVPAVILACLLVFLVAGCKTQTKAEENGGSEPGGNSSLMANQEIADSTFVNLDFSKFPSLPANEIPSTGVIYVSNSGNDSTGTGSSNSPFRSIAKALRQAVSGSTIVVSEGTYAEEAENGDYRALIINKSNITIMAVPGETVTLMPANGSVTYGISVMSNNTTIRGLQIKDFAQGILFADTTLENMVIADCTITGAAEAVATWGGTVNKLLACNVTILDAALIGFHCGNGYGNHWRLEQCTIAMTGVGSGSGADAFAIEHGDNILLVNCDVSGAAADGIDTKATRVVVYGCSVHHIGRNGIKFWHGGDVINTLVHHTGADAAIVVERGDVRLLNTTVAYHNYQGETSYNMTFGYDSHDSMEIQLINCIFYNTSGGAWMSPGASLKISHSLFFGMENGRLLDIGDNTILITQGAGALSLFGEHNLVANPLLKSDFRAQADSPIINAGIELNSQYPQKDKNGNPRIKNGQPDLGPFEDF